MSLLIRGGQVLAGAPSVLTRADVLVESDRITAVGAALAVPAGTREIDAAGRIVLPGLGNAHTHAASHLARGRAGNWTLEDLLTMRRRTTGSARPRTSTCRPPSAPSRCSRLGVRAPTTCSWRVPAPVPTTALEAIVRAYTDVGLRVIVAPAVADVVFYGPCPGSLDLLPPDLRPDGQGHRSPRPRQGLLDLTERDDPTMARRRGRARPDGGLADDPHPGHRRVPRRVWAAGARVRRRPPHASRGVQGAGDREPAPAWPDHRRPPRRPRRARPRLRRRPRGLAHRRRPSDARGGRRRHRPQPGEQSQARERASPPCARCSTAAWRWAWARTARCAPTTRTSSRPSGSRRSSARSDFPTTPPAGSSAAHDVGPGHRWRRAPHRPAVRAGRDRPRRKADLVLLRADSYSCARSPIRSTARLRRDRRRVDTVLVDGRVVVDVAHVHHRGRGRICASGPGRRRTARGRRYPDVGSSRRQLGPYVAAACRAAVATPLAINRYAAPLPPSA